MRGGLCGDEKIRDNPAGHWSRSDGEADLVIVPRLLLYLLGVLYSAVGLLFEAADSSAVQTELPTEPLTHILLTKGLRESFVC